MFTGVVEVGLFCNMAEAAYFGMEVRLPLSLHK
jgi:ribose 5-phosphate isomerase